MTELQEPLNQLTAAEVAEGIAGGAFTAEAVTAACLERIAARDGTVHAWAHLDAEAALAQARARDAGTPLGPLHGVPVGIKDVFDTCDAPTGMGSPIYAGYRPFADAFVVATLRAAGVVILGKTVTAEFAGLHPGATANPHDPARTPGGSSSGSAAAVADFMVPAALGTQTGGSVLRPASFCGVVGFKPSFAAISRAGLKLAAETLDTVGVMARSVEDAALLAGVLTGAAPRALEEPARPPAIGFCRTVLWERAEAETRTALEEARAGLTEAGAKVAEVEMPADFLAVDRARNVINAVERARTLAFEWARHREEISARLAETVREGLRTPHRDYVRALETCREVRARLDEVFGGNEALLVPCVPGAAPLGLESTGEPALQGFWTALHVPTITLPTHRTAEGLPVGIQLVGRPRADDGLLAAAHWMMARLGEGRR
jgi:amidase